MDTINRKPRRFFRRSGLMALCAVGAIASTASAAEPRGDDTERAEAKAIEAKAFFKGGLYPQAANSYLQGFAISHNSATLYNAARAYEQGKLYAEAIALFEQYLQLPDVPPDGQRDARERIAAARAQLRSAPPTAGKKPTANGQDKPAQATTGGVTQRCGTVAQVMVHTGPRPSFLNFERPFPKQAFAAVLSAAVRDHLQKQRGDLRKAYAGKIVCVEGKFEAADGAQRVVLASSAAVWLQGAPGK